MLGIVGEVGPSSLSLLFNFLLTFTCPNETQTICSKTMCSLLIGKAKNNEELQQYQESVVADFIL